MYEAGATDMATTAGISIQEYLRTSYTPDCEYIDGELKEKHVVVFHMVRSRSFWVLVSPASKRVAHPGGC